MIIISLKNGIIGIERIGTDEEVTLKDYDISQFKIEGSDVEKDELGYFVQTDL